MRPVPPRLPLLLLCCAAALPARAVTVTRVDVDGLPDPAMVENVRLSLSLVDAIGKDLSARRLGYLLRESEAETREALETFGYYSPAIVVQRSDRDAPEPGRDDPPASTPAGRTRPSSEWPDGSSATSEGRTGSPHASRIPLLCARSRRCTPRSSMPCRRSSRPCSSR